MEQEIIILSANAYSMELENGETKKGTSIFYIQGLEPKCNDTGKSYGYTPVKESLPYDFINDVMAVGGCPCSATVSFVLRVVGGKQLLKIGTIELSKGVKKQ